MGRVEDALAAAAEAGPFFVLEIDEPQPSTGPGHPWRPFERLAGGDLLPARIAAVVAVLAERAAVAADQIDPRAAASLVHLGLAARLVSPPLAAAVLGGAVLHLDPQRLYWRDVLGPVPLTHPGLTATSVDPEDAEAIAAATVAALAQGPVAGLTAAIGEIGVSRQVLWGNVASSFAAAAAGLVRCAPDRASTVHHVVQRVFAREPLHGQGSFGAAAPSGFKRTSCCLYYRIPGGGYCGDCVLAG